MKAQVLTSFEGPAGFEMQDIPEPTLRNKDDVRIRVEACGICHRDITYAHGKFGGGKLPSIMGHEGAGTVLEVGDGVVDLAPGDKVVHLQFAFCGECESCRSGRPQLCDRTRGTVGEESAGAFAEQMILPRHVFVKIPNSIDMPAASVTACTFGTAYHALLLYGFVPEGKTIALNGAGGGVGLQAIQVAKTLGARVIAVTTSEEKEEAIRKAGADEVIVSADGQYRKALGSMTNRQGVDLFLEIVGAPTLRESALSVRKGGRVVVVGNPEGGTCDFNPALLILRGELMMYGTVAVTPAELEKVIKLVAQGKVAPVIDQVASLEQLPDQMRRMEARKTIGRIVLSPQR